LISETGSQFIVTRVAKRLGNMSAHFNLTATTRSDMLTLLRLGFSHF
jgi:hypothetical protein